MGVSELDHGQALRFGDGKGSQAHSVQQLEDGGVGTDSQSQRQDGDGRESRILTQRAYAIAKVREQGLHIKARAALGHPRHFIGAVRGQLSGFANLMYESGYWPTQARSS